MWFQQNFYNSWLKKKEKRNKIPFILQHDNFPGRIISRNSKVNWPPRSYDTLRFLSLGHMKSKIYACNPATQRQDFTAHRWDWEANMARCYEQIRKDIDLSRGEHYLSLVAFTLKDNNRNGTCRKGRKLQRKNRHSTKVERNINWKGFNETTSISENAAYRTLFD